MENSIKQYAAKLLRSKFFYASFVVLFLSFAVNFFGVKGGAVWSDKYQQDSASIVELAVECHSQIGYDGGVIAVPATNTHENACSPSRAKPYESQYGLQSHIAIFMNEKMGISKENTIKTMQLILSVLLALVVAVVAYRAKSLYGMLAACIATVLSALNVWLVGFGGNVYWVAFTLILPFAFTFCFYNYFVRQKKQWMYYVLLVLILFVRFLNGYEYASSIIIAVYSAVLLNAYKKNVITAVVSTYKTIVLLCASGVVALSLAMAANFMSLQKYYGSTAMAYKIMITRVTNRTSSVEDKKSYVALGFRLNSTQTYAAINKYIPLDSFDTGKGNLIKYIMLSLISYLCLPLIHSPISVAGIFGELLFSATTCIGLFVVLSRTKKAKQDKQLRSLGVAVLMSLVGVFCWIIFMPGHSFPHTHINGILFSLSFITLFSCYLGVFIGRRTGQRVRKV